MTTSTLEHATLKIPDSVADSITDPLIQHAIQLSQNNTTHQLYQSIPKRIAYIVSHGQSYASNGYAIRTQGIAHALNQHGYETLCFVRPGRPWDLGASTGSVPSETTIDGVRYIHSRWQNNQKPLSEIDFFNQSLNRFTELFHVYRPEIVLAASNYLIALPAWVAAKQFNLPFFYEVRGFWELSQAALDLNYENTPEYHQEIIRDTFIAQKANRVFTLNQPMKEELFRRGVSTDKIGLMPNGVKEIPEIKPPNQQLKQELGIKYTDKVVGYIGSFNAYEGLDRLIHACNKLKENGIDIKLLLVGDEHKLVEHNRSAFTTRQEQMLKLDKNNILVLSGRVKHGKVSDYYGIMDLVVVPREESLLTKLVTPVKLLEAVSYSKIVLVPEHIPYPNTLEKSQVVSYSDPEELPHMITQCLTRAPSDIKPSDQITWFNSTRKIVQEIAYSRQTDIGSDLKSLSWKPKILTLLDEFSEHCFKPDAELIPLSKTDWGNQVLAGQVDMFLAESAWRGNGGTWNYCMTKYTGKYGVELHNVLKKCRQEKIPTIFWNKEDPINFDVFIDVAKEFDYVFTTDIKCVPKYKEILGHNRVSVLQFAAQPEIHNPILTTNRNDKIAFAGSWSGRKYPSRDKWLDLMLKPLIERGILDIFDRYASAKDKSLKFPDAYTGAVHDAVPYGEIAEKVYKRYAALVNVNSIEDSLSMVARRIFELSASGTPIISSPSPALRGDFSKAVDVIYQKSDVESKINKILNEPLYALRKGAFGVRLTHSEHTYRHRLDTIYKTIGLSSSSNHIDEPITAICVSKRPEFLGHVSKMLNQQTHNALNVIFVAHGAGFNDDQIKDAFDSRLNLKILHLEDEELFLADGLNLAIQVAQTDLLSKIDDDDYYGPNYIKDAVLAFSYSKAGLVGKGTYFCYVESTNQTGLRFPGKHYRYFKRVHGGTLVWNQKRTGNLQFERVRQGTDSAFLKALQEKQIPILSIDPFNFVHMRYNDLGQHTWKITDGDFMKNMIPLTTGLDLDIAYV